MVVRVSAGMNLMIYVRRVWAAPEALRSTVLPQVLAGGLCCRTVLVTSRTVTEAPASVGAGVPKLRSQQTLLLSQE